MNHPIVISCENDRKAQPYLAALREVGVPAENLHLVTPANPPENGRELAAHAAGVVLCGGPDFAPSLYGEEAIAEADLRTVPELDALDRSVFEGARAAKTPVWAICRGMQGANIFLGGSLYQDLELQLQGAGDHDAEEAPHDFLTHGLTRVDQSSRFGQLFDHGGVMVNSRHHQAIRNLAPGLAPVAWAPDGVLEVTEWTGHDWWLRGVQWHPEDILHLPLQRKLWQQFVAAAAAHDAGLEPAGMR
jgi:putative glutamine amidotransferase